MPQTAFRPNHMRIAWHDYAVRDADIPISAAPLREKASVIGRTGLMLLSCGTGAWRVRSSMNTLAEELGHHHTSVGNIIDMENVSNRKQERQARFWGYNKLIGLTGIVNAFESGCQSAYEASEFLEVTVEYLQECIDCYRDKYGICTEIGNYIIYFIPNLAVMEKV